jgi:hypothetical protein
MLYHNNKLTVNLYKIHKLRTPPPFFSEGEGQGGVTLTQPTSDFPLQKG